VGRVSDPARPLRGTRPANRRELILGTATDLFAARGYEHVSVSDIAAEVAVGPSALYRHFPGKEQLLVEVIRSIVGDFVDVLDRSQGSDVIAACAAFALDHRATGVLWEREARHLSADSYAIARDSMRSARAAFERAVIAAEPGATSTTALAALSVILSPSFHRIHLPRPGYDRLLAGLARQVLTTALPEPPPTAAVAPHGLGRSSTRASLVDSAVRLFAERTYASVSMESVAASLGMAPSSLYNHLPNKSDLLLTALTRADGYLQLTMDQVLAQSTHAAQALAGLVDTYAAFAVRNPNLVAVLVTETRNLPADEGAQLRLDQRQYVDEWVHLYRATRPDLDRGEARVAVHALLMTMNDLARTPGVQSRPDAEQVLQLLGCRILGLADGGGSAKVGSP
jgi:AcrR family transcriptional regulator